MTKEDIETIKKELENGEHFAYIRRKEYIIFGFSEEIDFNLEEHTIIISEDYKIISNEFFEREKENENN